MGASIFNAFSFRSRGLIGRPHSVPERVAKSRFFWCALDYHKCSGNGHDDGSCHFAAIIFTQLSVKGGACIKRRSLVLGKQLFKVVYGISARFSIS